MNKKKLIKEFIRLVIYIAIGLGASQLFFIARAHLLSVEVFSQGGEARVLVSVPASIIPGTWKPLEGACGSADPTIGETAVLAVGTPKGHLFYALSEYQLFRLGEGAGDSKFIGEPFSGSPVLRIKILPLPEGAHELFTLTNKGLFVSGDQGDTWKEVTPKGAGPPLQSFAVANGKHGPIIAVISKRDIFVSNDGGQTWNSLPATAGEDYYHDVEVLLRNEQPIVFLASKNGLLKTELPAVNWEAVSKFKGDSILSISKTATLDSARQVLEVVVAGWSGLLSYVSGPQFWQSQDLGATWERTSVPYIGDSYYPLLRTELFNELNGHKTTVIPLTSGKYLLSRNGEKNWSFLELSGVDINPEYLRNAVGDPSGSIIYGMSKAGQILEIDLEQKVWREVRIRLPTLAVRKIAVSSKASGGTAFFAATETEVFTSSDEGVTWNSLGSLPVETEVTTLSISPNFDADQTLYVGTVDGLYTYHLPSRRWNKNESLSDTRVTSICFSPAFSVDNRVLVGSNAGIFLSEDRGANWSQKTKDLGGVFVNQISGSPNGNFYAATRQGLYSSVDKGGSWQQLGKNLASKNVLSIGLGTVEQSDTLIVAGTADGAFSSRDNGATWERLLLPSGSFSISSVLVVPEAQDKFVLYLGTVGGGVVSSEDGGKTWKEMPASEKGLQVWDLELVQPRPVVLLAGTLNRSIWMYRAENAQ